MKSSCHFFDHLGMPTKFSDSNSPVSILHGTNLYSLTFTIHQMFRTALHQFPIRFSTANRLLISLYCSTHIKSSNHTPSLHRLNLSPERFVFSSISKNVKIRIYETIILPLVLYGYETWSLILRDVHRLRVLANRVLRRIFGPKRNEVAGG
jgi:hypothetical protein